MRGRPEPMGDSHGWTHHRLLPDASLHGAFEASGWTAHHPLHVQIVCATAATPQTPLINDHLRHLLYHSHAPCKLSPCCPTLDVLLIKAAALLWANKQSDTEIPYCL